MCWTRRSSQSVAAVGSQAADRTGRRRARTSRKQATCRPMTIECAQHCQREKMGKVRRSPVFFFPKAESQATKFLAIKPFKFTFLNAQDHVIRSNTPEISKERIRIPAVSQSGSLAPLACVFRAEKALPLRPPLRQRAARRRAAPNASFRGDFDPKFR